MSCRVLSRGVGTILLSYIMHEANKAGKKLFAEFKRTDRNKQMYVSFKFNNFKEVKNENNFIIFENDLTTIHPFPPYIKVGIINNFLEKKNYGSTPEDKRLYKQQSFSV